MPHQVRSGPSSQSTFVQFKNDTDMVVSVSWIDYEGKEVPYEKIQPGKYYRQQTFVGHPWSFRTNATREQLVVDRRVLFVPVQSSTDFVASIQHPAAITWSPCKHDAFPEDFHAAVQALLLCHGSQGKLQSLEDPLPGSLKRKGSGLSNLLNKRNPLQTSSSNLRSLQPQKTMLSSLPHDLVLDIIRRSAPVVLDIEDL
ncbi:Tumour suppressor protein von Hippel-Lindau disease [Klebsormidium nitens]|uniref:Tumour suppressor protein von Hippel-Lindau disease n=1 Tax=Klebsormidium nitens TaxID=105231 RepID=A0A1Y1IN22_KLENI|nr:Tumour suppressor protein von Hippel-Lindau disease [Klebsormidium nitens]|eukprot:GAQ92053.1 Tumour suppressor protein von Hippel-Lindau disease [Klebsormidium nitens]